MSLDTNDYKMISNVYVETAKTNHRLERVIDLLEKIQRELERGRK